MSEIDSEKIDFELDWIYAQYEEGISVAAIAKELGKSEAYVYAHMKRKPEKYEDVKRIREENHSLRIRRIRGLADKIVLEYLEKLAGQKDLGPADIDRANRISKDYDHRVLLAEGKNTENIGVGGTGITMIVRKTYPDKETAENACDD